MHTAVTAARYRVRSPSRTDAKIRLAALGAVLGFLCFTPSALAAQAETHVEQTGELPRHGKVVLRSGMAWLDESANAFQKIATAFGRELTARGLTLLPVKPSALEPMPKTPLPNRTKGRDLRKRPDIAAGTPEEEALRKAGELGKEGKLPQLKLRRYNTPDSDTDLPESVRSITAPDVTRALYARSQQTGKPVVQSFAIPGRMPAELQNDAQTADYAIIIRFAAVRAWAALPEPKPLSPLEPGSPGVLVAAASIGGTGALGFGPPAQASPPGSGTYGTSGGYVRGYEGSARGDFWGRDSDFYQRDYQFKHGPQPNYATPPSGLSPSGKSRTGRTGTRGFGVDPLPGRGHGPAAIGWHLILFDCFDLAPVRTGKKPVRVWQAAVRSPGETTDFDTTIPKMIRAVFAPQRQP